VLITSPDTITDVREAAKEVDQRAAVEEEVTGRGSGQIEVLEGK
jgi:hypothetical protein